MEPPVVDLINDAAAILVVRHFLDDDNPVLWAVWELIS